MRAFLFLFIFTIILIPYNASAQKVLRSPLWDGADFSSEEEEPQEQPEDKSRFTCAEEVTETPPFWILDKAIDQSEHSAKSYQIWQPVKTIQLEKYKNEEWKKLVPFKYALRGEYVIPTVKLDEKYTNTDAQPQGNDLFIPVYFVGNKDPQVFNDLINAAERRASDRQSQHSFFLVDKRKSRERNFSAEERVKKGDIGWVSYRSLLAPDTITPENLPDIPDGLKSEGRVHIVKKDTVFFDFKLPKGTVLSLDKVSVSGKDQYTIEKCCNKESPQKCNTRYFFLTHETNKNIISGTRLKFDPSNVCTVNFLQNMKSIPEGSLAPLIEASRIMGSNIADLPIMHTQATKSTRKYRGVRVGVETLSLIRFPGLENEGLKDEFGGIYYRGICNTVHHNSEIGAVDAYINPITGCAAIKSMCNFNENDCPKCITQVGEIFAPRGYMGGIRSIHATHHNGNCIDFRPIRTDRKISSAGVYAKEHNRKQSLALLRRMINSGVGKVLSADKRMLRDLAQQILFDRKYVIKNNKGQIIFPTLLAQKDAEKAYRKLVANERDISPKDLYKFWMNYWNTKPEKLLFELENVDLRYDAKHDSHFHVEYYPELIEKRVPECSDYKSTETSPY